MCIRGIAGNGLGGDEYTGESPPRYAILEGTRKWTDMDVDVMDLIGCWVHGG